MDAETNPIQAFLRRSLGLPEAPDVQESVPAGLTAANGPGSGNGAPARAESRRARDYRLYWLERKRSLTEAAQDHPGRSPLRSLVSLEADLAETREATEALTREADSVLAASRETAASLAGLGDRQTEALAQVEDAVLRADATSGRLDDSETRLEALADQLRESLFSLRKAERRGAAAIIEVEAAGAAANAHAGSLDEAEQQIAELAAVSEVLTGEAESLVRNLDAAICRADTSHEVTAGLQAEVRRQLAAIADLELAWQTRGEALQALQDAAAELVERGEASAVSQAEMLVRQEAFDARANQLLARSAVSEQKVDATQQEVAAALASANRQLRIGEVSLAETRALREQTSTATEVILQDHAAARQAIAQGQAALAESRSSIDESTREMQAELSAHARKQQESIERTLAAREAQMDAVVDTRLAEHANEVAERQSSLDQAVSQTLEDLAQETARHDTRLDALLAGHTTQLESAQVALGDVLDAALASAAEQDVLLDESRETLHALRAEGDQRLNAALDQFAENACALRARLDAALTARLRVGERAQSQREAAAQAALNNALEHNAVQTAALLQSGNERLSRMGRALADRLQRTLQDDLGRTIEESRTHLSAVENHFGSQMHLALAELTERSEAHTDALAEDTKRRTTAALAGLEADKRRLELEMESLLSHRTAEVRTLDDSLCARADATFDTIAAELQRVVEARDEMLAAKTAQREIDGRLRALSGRCESAVSSVEQTLSELADKDRQAHGFHEVLIHEASRLRDESLALRAQLGDLADTMLGTQQDAVRSQELTQEINTHSLALNEQTSTLLERFDELNDRNGAVMTELLHLKSGLETSQTAVAEHLTGLASGLAQLDVADAQFGVLNNETRTLQERMEVALRAADERIDATRALTSGAEAALDSLHAERARWMSFLDEVSQAQAACEETTTGARESIQRAQDLATGLEAELVDAKTLRERTQTFLSSGEARVEALQGALTQAELTEARMQGETQRAQQITDDLYRGLNAAVDSQRESETRVDTTLAETERLQSEMRDILSLREGLDGFRSDLSAQDQQLATCLESIAALGARLDTQQVTLDEQDAAARRHNDDVVRYQSTIGELQQRLARFETRLEDQALRTDELAQKEPPDLRGEIDRIQEQMGAEVRRQVRKVEAGVARQTEQAEAHLETRIDGLERELHEGTLDEDVRNLVARQRSTEEGFGRLSDQIARQRSEEYGELQRVADAADQQFGLMFERLDDLEQNQHGVQGSFKRIDERIAADRQAIREELGKLRRQQEESAGQGSFADVVERFNLSMNEALATNRELRDALGGYRSDRSRTEPADQDELIGARAPARAPAAPQDRDPGAGQQTPAPRRAAGLAPGGALAQALRQGESAPPVRGPDLDPASDTKRGQTVPDTTPGQSGIPRKRRSAARQTAVTAVMAAALLVTGLFGGQHLNARPVDALSAALDAAELQVEIAGYASNFAWPVSYGVSDPLGPAFQHARAGINIPAELGDPVLAVKAGVVLHAAQSVRGMGHLIVIEHEDGLQSVYANNQFNYVKAGDRVSRGQLIADVGPLFNTGHAGLYFEMREAGEARDPLEYLQWSGLASR